MHRMASIGLVVKTNAVLGTESMGSLLDGTSLYWLTHMTTVRSSEFRSHSLRIVKQVSVDVLFPHDVDTVV